MKHSWVEVDLGKLERNLKAVQAAMRPETALIFVVKANAYGHGMAPVARRAAKAGVKWFAVAYLHEALALREAVAEADILVIGAVEPGDAPVLAEQRITPIVVDEPHGVALAAAAHAAGKTLAVHLKIDTGMGRLGVPWEEAAAVYERLSRKPGLDIRGLCTHFASVEVRRPSLAPTQMERFQQVEQALARRGAKKLFRHVSSSRGLLNRRDWDFEGVRPGIIVYGYGARREDLRLRTEPILQWKTGVMQVKKVPAGTTVGYVSTYTTPAPTTLATLAVGYADGYHRALSNKGFVLVGGCRCPVLGRVSMNWITVDLGPDSAVRAGDEAVLIGEQGGESVWADDLARLAMTIPYEILTSIHPSAERKYI